MFLFWLIPGVFIFSQTSFRFSADYSAALRNNLFEGKPCISLWFSLQTFYFDPNIMNTHLACFSSPEQILTMSFCDRYPSVVHRPSGVRLSVRRLFTFSNDFSFEITGLFQSKLCLKHQYTGRTKLVKCYWLELFPVFPWQPGTKS